MVDAGALSQFRKQTFDLLTVGQFFYRSRSHKTGSVSSNTRLLLLGPV